jgi:hypothetical protein
LLLNNQQFVLRAAAFATAVDAHLGSLNATAQRSLNFSLASLLDFSVLPYLCISRLGEADVPGTLTALPTPASETRVRSTLTESFEDVTGMKKRFAPAMIKIATLTQGFAGRAK